MYARLRFIASVLMLCLGAGISAQDFSGKYYLQNVGSGLWLGCANSWGTQASLVEHPEYVILDHLSNGKYTIETQVSNGGTNYYFTGSYMDGTALEVTITAVSDGIYNIGSGSVLFGYANSGVLAGNLTNGNDVNAQWRILSEDDMSQRLGSASELTPMDATYLILDPNFGRNNRNVAAWTMAASHQNLSGGNYVNNCAESFHSTFSLSQTISVPNGIYELTAQGFYRQDGSDNTNLPHFIANSEEIAFPLKSGSEGNMSDASVSFSSGLYTIEPIRVTVTDGTLTVGAYCNNTTLWCIWDNFELTYYGLPEDLGSYESALANLVAQAAALDGQVPSAAFAAIDAVVQANNATYSSVAEYTEAINAIKGAILQYGNSEMKSAYANYLNKRAQAEKLSQQKVYVPDVMLDVSTADATAQAATTVAGIEQATAALGEAVATFLSGSTLLEGCVFDVTEFYVTNPTPYYNSEGWTCSTAPTLDSYNRCSEFWEKPGASISQSISGLPTGYYRFECIAFTRTGMSAMLSADEESMPISTVEPSSANDKHTAAAWFDAGNSINTLYFKYDGAADLTISLTADEQTADYWLVWRSFGLQYLGSDELAIERVSLSAAVSEAETLLAEHGASCTEAVKALLASAIEAGKMRYDTADEINAALANVNAAILTAKETMALYDDYIAKRAAAGEIPATDGLTEKEDGAFDKFAAAMKVADATASEASTPTALKTAIAQLRQGVLDLIADVRPAEGSPIELSFMLENTDFEQGGELTTGILPGWTCTFIKGENATHIGLMTANYDSDEAHITNYFMEAWQENAWPYVIGDGKLYQTLSGLPVGRYRLSADVIAVDQYQDHNPVSGAYIYIESGAIETKEAIATGNGSPKHFEVDFLNDFAESLTFGLKTEGTDANWIAADNFHIYLVEALDESPGVTALKEELAKYEGVSFGQCNNEVLTAFTSELERAALMAETDIYSAEHSTECLQEIPTLQSLYDAVKASEKEYAEQILPTIKDMNGKISSIGEYAIGSPLYEDWTRLANEAKSMADQRVATAQSIMELYNQMDEREEYWQCHLTESEIDALRQLQTSLQTNNGWSGSWDLDAESLRLDEVHIIYGWVYALYLKEQGLTGTILAADLSLPHLNLLDLRGNSIRAIDGTFPATIANLSLTNQVLQDEVVIDLPTVSEEGLLAQLPPIVCYDGGPTSGFRFYMQDEEGVMQFDNLDGGLGVVFLPTAGYGTYVYRHASGDVLTFTNSYGDGTGDAIGTTFPVRITFEGGDSNFDGVLDASDIQTTINHIFGEMVDYCFNFTAADLWADNIINVQDVVKEVDLVIAQPVVPQTEGEPSGAPRRMRRHYSEAGASLTFEGGQLVLATETPVSVLDVVVGTTAAVDWSPLMALGFTVVTRQTDMGMRAIAYSMSGAVVPVGTMAIATVADSGRATVVAASLTDALAKSIRVALGSQIATGIAAAGTATAAADCYDLSGRRVAAPQQRGLYIRDGRKIVVK